MQTFLRIILSPVAVLYRAGVAVRYALYTLGIKKRIAFNLPVITVGNLSVGGTGKTPHVAWMLDWLGKRYKVGMISRGYGRTTNGFRLITDGEGPETIGDEPWMLHQQFPDVPMAVGERRILAIPMLLQHHPDIEVIVLDDAFQHLPVKAAYNVLLTTWQRPFTKDFLLPAGRLREPRSAAQRADAIVVTKCPETSTVEERQGIAAQVQVHANQWVGCSGLRYGAPYPLWPTAKPLPSAMVAVAGIASPEVFFQAVKELADGAVETLSFPDHHRFRQRDIERISRLFGNLAGPSKGCITTAKDAVRLLPFQQAFQAAGIDFWVLPVNVHFFDREEAIQQRIEDCIKNFEGD